jgi:toxin ParE1/3/4
MKPTLVVTSRAEADLVAAYEWYEQRSPGLGRDFIRCVDAKLAVIGHSPQLFCKRRGEYRLSATARFPHAIYYIWDEAAARVSVRRILHFSQHTPAHLAK